MQYRAFSIALRRRRRRETRRTKLIHSLILSAIQSVLDCAEEKEREKEKEEKTHRLGDSSLRLIDSLTCGCMKLAIKSTKLRSI